LIQCHQWCNAGRCFYGKCLCTDSTATRCLNEQIPNWSCDIKDYNDTLVCHFCGVGTPDPDCQGYTLQDCSNNTPIQISTLQLVCKKNPVPLTPIPASAIQDIQEVFEEIHVKTRDDPVDIMIVLHLGVGTILVGIILMGIVHFVKRILNWCKSL